MKNLIYKIIFLIFGGGIIFAMTLGGGEISMENLSAADYRDGTILLIKPVATGVGEGRLEAGDIIEVKDGEALFQRFGSNDFLGKEEKKLLVFYLDRKLTDAEKTALTESEYMIDKDSNQIMVKRRKMGIDYTKVLSMEDQLKAVNTISLDKIPQVQYIDFTIKPEATKSVVPSSILSLGKVIRKLIPIAYAGTGGTKTICTSGCDYTTLNGWEGTEQGILAEPAIAQITEGFQDTTAVTINGWTTSADNYIKIYTTAQARHGGKYNTSKYRLEVANSRTIIIYEEYVRIDGLQIYKSASNSDNLAAVSIFSSGTGVTHISNSILRQEPNNSYTQPIIFVNNANITINVWNSLLYGGGTYAGSDNSGIHTLAGIANIYNTTVVDGGYKGIYREGGTVVCKNCYAKAFGVGGAYNGTMTLVTSASADTSGSVGLQNIAYSTTNFTNVSAGTEDFHLPLGSALINVGTDTSGDVAPLNFTTDIDGQTRTGTWDIGADEYVAAGGAATPQGGIIYFE